MGGTDFKWGAGHHWPPAGDGPDQHAAFLKSHSFEHQLYFHQFDEGNLFHRLYGLFNGFSEILYFALQRMI